MTPRRTAIRHRAVAWVAALLVIALTTSLGFWQLRRAEQKIALQQTWDQTLAQPPLMLSAATVGRMAGDWPRRVSAQGRWLPEATVWLDNRALDGRAGFWVVTPLALADGSATVLVLRGWAPRDARDRLALPPLATPTGLVSIDGVAVRELSSLYAPGGSSERGPLPAVWQNLDVGQFTAVSGLSVEPWLVHQTGETVPGQWPRALPVQVAQRVDRHYGYAVQWFALAALVAGLSLYFSLRNRLRRSRGPQP